ncbi:MAG: LuxR C-terminal-related transcriptional regulator [Chloroflexota bacterium]
MGRTRELAQLGRALDEAAAGTPRVVLLLGPAGIGKSALLRRAATDHGLPLHVGACLRLTGGQVPYLPFIELLRGMVERLPPGELLPILGPARGEVARLLPELGPARHREEDPGMARALLFEQLRGVAERLGSAGTRVLAIEDLQWADASTSDLLLFLVRNVRRTRLLLLLTCRTDELGPDHPFWAFAAELERGENVERLELDGLAPGELAALAQSVLGGPLPADRLERLGERTLGNPLFAEELLAAGGADPGAPVPPRLRDALASRLGGTSAEVQRLTGLLAITDRHADAVLLERLTGWTPELLDAAMRAGSRTGVLGTAVTPDGLPVPRHPLLGEVAAAALSPMDRAAAHAAVATSLAARGDGPEIQAEVAGRWLAAGVLDRALAASVAAGMAAGNAVAPPEALAHLETALGLFDRVPDAARVAGMDRVALLERLADAALRAGRPERAVTADLDALARVDAATDPGRAAALRQSLRWARWTAGDAAGALAEAEATLALLADGPPSLVRATTLAHLGGLRLALGDVRGAIGAADDALAEAGRLPDAAAETALAIGVRGLALIRLGAVDEGLALVRGAWERAVALHHVTGIALAHAQLAGALAALGRADEAAALAQEGIEEAERLGLDRTFGVLLRAQAAAALLELGRWTEARRHVAAGLAGDPAAAEGIAIHAVAARLAAASGDAAGAGRHLAAARALVGPPGGTSPPASPGAVSAAGSRGGAGRTSVPVSSFVSASSPVPVRAPVPVGLALAEAEAALARDDAPAVRAAVDAGRAAPDAGAGEGVALALLGLAAEMDTARTARARGLPAEVVDARSRAARHLARLRAPWPGADPALVDAIRRTGLALAGGARPGLALRRWVESAEAWLQAGRPVAAARASAQGAAAALAARDRETAARLATGARAEADAVGAAPLVAFIDDLARRARLPVAGAVPPSSAAEAGPAQPAGPHLVRTLTERELEVLRLLAEGRTNREIGEALFISPKTVSVHVTNLLDKLGVDGRVEAATMALRLGLVPPA